MPPLKWLAANPQADRVVRSYIKKQEAGSKIAGKAKGSGSCMSGIIDRYSTFDF
jgi:hypothetical protein